MRVVGSGVRVGRILAAAGSTRVRDFDLRGVRACYNMPRLSQLILCAVHLSLFH
jgi:hypothetical protein